MNIIGVFNVRPTQETDCATWTLNTTNPNGLENLLVRLNQTTLGSSNRNDAENSLIDLHAKQDHVIRHAKPV